MMSTASSADSTLTIGRIGPKISSCNKYFTFWPFSFVRLCVCLSGLSVSCMSVCQCVCMCVCGGLSSSTFIRESSSLTPETTVGSIKFVVLSLPPPTTTLPALIVGIFSIWNVSIFSAWTKASSITTFNTCTLSSINYQVMTSQHPAGRILKKMLLTTFSKDWPKINVASNLIESNADL